MRLAAFVVAIVLSNVVVVGGITLLVLAGPHVEAPLVWLPVTALMLIVYPPLLVGTLLSTWNVRSSEETVRYFRRWFTGLGVAQALGAVATVLFSVLGPAAWWLAPLYLVVSALLDLLAIRVGTALRRREDARFPSEPRWTPITRQEIVRRILVVVGVFVGVLLVSSIGLPLLFALDRGKDHLVDALLFGFEFACLAAGLACTATTLRLQRQVREQVTRDVGVLRRIAKVVVRGKRIELQPGEEALAARYAAITAVTLAFSLGFVLLLYVGIAAQQVEQILDGRTGGFSTGLLVFLVVALVVLVPLQVVRIRRVRAYAREHAALLPAA